MRRLLPAVVLVALLVAVALVWFRSEPADNIAARPEDRTVVVTLQDPATELGAPKIESASRSDAAPTLEPEPAVATTPTWTGVRVRVLASETREPLANVRLMPRIEGVRQSLKEVDDFHAKSGTIPRTDERGIAELEFDPGTTGTILARRDDGATGPGTATIDTPITAGEVRELEILVATKPDLVFHGRVVDRETNAPIPNARVGRSQGWSKILDADEQLTDADGRFRVTGRSWSQPVVNVIKTGYEVACVKLFKGHEDAAKPYEIELSLVASARVTVLDQLGAPIPDVSASLFTATYNFGRPDGMALIHAGWTDDAHFRAKTDANGVAVITDLPTRKKLEGVVHRGREEILKAPEKITLEPGELRELVWRLGAGGRIEGVALELDGRPAAGIPIGLQATNMPRNTYFRSVGAQLELATTDAEGRFVFADVPPGTYLVGPAPKKFTRERTVEADEIAPLGQLVVVRTDAEPTLVTVRLHRGLAIRGRVLTPTGEPAQRALIRGSAADDSSFANENMNDPEGRFVLGPLEAGEYRLIATSTGEYVESESVVVRTGDVDVVLQLRRGGAVRGIVVDASTGIACSADMLVNPRDPTTWSMRSERSRDDGSFEIDGLAPGTYDVAASTEDGRIGLASGLRVEAGASGEEVRIAVTAGAKVRVRYVGPWRVAGISVLVGESPVVGDGMEKGTERTFNTPAGSVVVRVRHHAEKKEFDLPLVLKVGETRDLVFDGTWK